MSRIKSAHPPKPGRPRNFVAPKTLLARKLQEIFARTKTWREIATIMGASERSAGCYLRGDRKPPLRVCENIKVRMGVSIDEVVAREYAIGESGQKKITDAVIAEREKHYRAALDSAIIQLEKTLETLRALRKGQDDD